MTGMYEACDWAKHVVFFRVIEHPDETPEHFCMRVCEFRRGDECTFPFTA